MTLFDSLLQALRSIDDWLVANVDNTPQRQSVFLARRQLSSAMDTIIGIELEAALNALGDDAAKLQACTTRLVNVARTIDTAQRIVNDVATVAKLVATVAELLPPQ